MDSKKLAVFMAAVFMVSIFATAASCSDDSNAATKTIVVETSPDFAPYDYYYGTEFSGIDMDILRAIEKVSNVKFEFKQNNFDSIILSVTQGKCDMGASGFTISDERKKEVNFSDPYTTIKQVVVAKNDKNYTSEDQVKGLKISVETGTSGADYAETLSSNIIYQKTYGDIVNDLLHGKADCEVVDQPVAEAQVTSNPELKIFDILNADVEYYGFVFAKNASGDENRQIVNEGLKKIQDNGTLNKIMQYYADHGYSAETPPYYGYNIKNIIVETSPDFAPYDYYYGTEFCGIDMDILRAVEKVSNIRFTFHQNNFDSIILSVAQSKCDMGASGFTINDLRKESVNFSEPYATIKQVVVAKNDKNYTSEDQIKGLKISVETGTSGAEYAETLSSNIVYQKTYSDIVNDLLSGKADCEIVDDAVAYAQLSSNPSLKIYDVLNADIEEYGFIFAKNVAGDENLTAINDALAKLKEDGTLDDIKKYYSDNGYSPETPSYYNREKTIFALYSECAPYVYKLGTQYAGFEADILKAVANDMGYKLKFVEKDFNEIIDTVNTEVTYIGACGISDTTEREELVKFSTSYFQVGLTLAVKPSSDITSTDALAGKKIAVLSGSTGQDYVTAKGATAVPFENEQKALEAVMNGEVDGAILDDISLRSLLNKYSKDTLEERNILGDAPKNKIAFAFNPDSALYAKFNASLSKLTEDKTIEKILNYYESNNYSPTTESFFKENTSSNWWDQMWEKFKRDFIDNDRYQFLVKGLCNTLEITALAFIVGVGIGTVAAAIMSMSAITGRWKIPNAICKVYVTIIRGTPVMVQLLIIYYVIFASVNMNQILVASVAFGLNSGAYVAEIMRSGINSVPKGQMEAARSLGLSSTQAMKSVILPQALRNILPALGNESISLLKETSIAGYIGIIDLTRGADIIRGQTYDALFPLLVIAVIYLAIVLVMTYLIRLLEKRLNNAY